MPSRHRSARRLTAAALAAVALAGPGVAAPTATASPLADVAAAAPTLRFVDIPGAGGVRLEANVIAPSDGAVRHPLVVMPASWALDDLEYLVPAEQLAASGYVVVSYTPRGFWGSGGTIDVAGPQSRADLSKVIDWSLVHTDADPEHIGTAGISYGAGIGLLGSAFDPRIKAVVAMSGWADLVGSLYGDETQHLQSTAVLALLGGLTGRPSSGFRQVLSEFFGSDRPAEQAVKAWARERSPQTYLDRINANHPAVMLANAWGDSIFPPNQLIPFFQRLQGPKRLELRPGDHATAELTGLLGLPNTTWSSARAWLDHYLKGADNGVTGEPQVRLQPQLQDYTESFPSWSAVGSHPTTLHPGPADRWGTGSLGPAPAAGWSRTFGTWADSGADGGMVVVSGLSEQVLKLPPLVSVPLLPRALCDVWQTGPEPVGQRIRGEVRLSLRLRSNRGTGSFVAYLYDVDPLGVGRLVTQAPYTFLDRTPGQVFDADLALQATAYDVPAGHRLALVVDGVDPLYLTHDSAGEQLTFEGPSAVTVPLE
ncbi:CocE/NonD family hydrolase [Streptacidiphilus melanogenes]|uniref:CocE/NonD family hydrolase n=1 Tax=Streptacidiphilus melanogenes TaxID=411235 RepID=UPI0005A6C4AA|nr:CocE/NonD family hydrolase [Streptacidiphilus melanogenes]